MASGPKNEQARPAAMDRKSASTGRIGMILATERLVAEQGFRRVTARDINAAANMRNSSAIQYHFGNIDRLIQAVFEYRMEHTNERRLEMARGIDPENIHGLVDAMIVPLAEELLPRPEGNYYLRFLLQHTHEGSIIAPWFVEPKHREGLVQIEGLLRQYMAYLPHKIVETRMAMLRLMMVSGLAGIEIGIASGKIGQEAIATSVTAVNHAMVGLLLAPPRPAAGLSSVDARD